MEPKRKKTRADWERCVAELEMDRIETQMDLDGCQTRLMQATTRLGTVQVEHTAEVKRLNAIISAQRDWIVTLERRLQTALNEVMELRGEGDDETV
jgi:septal ring factor EnvC (AmiA/AmiB activator)